MRIIHVIPVYVPAWNYGGPVLSVSRLCEGLTKSGVVTEVITTNAGLSEFETERLNKPVIVDGVKVTYYSVDSVKGPIKSRALVADLPNIMSRADLLHLSAIWQPIGVSVQRAAIDFCVPVLHSMRGALSSYSLRSKWWKKIPYFYLRELPLLTRASGIHVTSIQEQQEIARLGLKVPSWLLPNPMNLSRLHPDAELGRAWRQQLDVNLGTPIFLICGRLHHKKGLDLLPAVLNKLRGKDWKLLIVGQDCDGSGASLIHELARCELSDRVIKHPMIAAEHLGGIYNAADLLLLPSRQENFGNVVIEAMACGCGPRY